MSKDTKRITELEEKLFYLIKSTMTLEQKIKCLSDAHFQAWNAGYCDAMANKLMSGIEDFQTEMWEQNCRYKYQIDELLNLLQEVKKDGDGEC